MAFLIAGMIGAAIGGLLTLAYLVVLFIASDTEEDDAGH